MAKDKEKEKSLVDSVNCSGTNSFVGCNWDTFQGNTSNLLGELLTIIDASYQDITQREAVKSLIKQAVQKYRGTEAWRSYIYYYPISPTSTYPYVTWTGTSATGGSITYSATSGVGSVGDVSY